MAGGVRTFAGVSSLSLSLTESAGLADARARVNSRRVNESQITSGVMHYFMEPPAAASCSCLRQRGTQMHGSVRGCRLVRAPSLRITGTRGHTHFLMSRCLLLLAVLLATESQLVGFGAAIGRRYDAAARHQCGLLHAAPHGLLASRIGLGHGSRLWPTEPQSGANGFAPGA